MAEFIMKQLVTRAGRADEFEIASAAVSTEEIGNDIYPPAKRMLAAKNVPFVHRAARQMTRADYAYYDHIVCMDQSNLRWLRYIIGEDTDNKVSLMMAWAGKNRDVANALVHRRFYKGLRRYPRRLPRYVTTNLID